MGGFFIAALALAPLEAREDLKTDTPSLNTIKKSLADRFALLKPHFEDGRVGLRHDGGVALREAGAAGLSREERNALEALVADDNKDRDTLLREMARANGRPDLEDELRAAFALRWRERAPSGWWLADKAGRWSRKP